MDTKDERDLTKKILKGKELTPSRKINRIKTFKLDENENEIEEPIKVETIIANADEIKKQKEKIAKLEKTIQDKSAERLKNLELENIGTRTQASLIFVPKLDVAQPAVIQSLSLRNFFQFFNPDSDPTNVRNKVWNEIADNPYIKITDYSNGASQKVTYDVSKLTTKTMRQLVVEHIVDQRLKERWSHTALDLFSVDIGLTAPSTTIGTGGDTFDNDVDKDFPEFLFGGGIHYEAFSLSFGSVLYRNEKQHFKTSFYVGLSIDLYKTTLPALGTDKQVQDQVKKAFEGM